MPRKSKSIEPEEKRFCGRVALAGRPNAGKSTLLNYLVGEKIAAVSDKPQTTRWRVLGIRTTGNRQTVFVDTPGIHRPEYLLNERMMDTVFDTLRGVDLVVHLVDASESFGKGEQYAIDLMKTAEVPVILALNKIDLINKGKLLPLMESYHASEAYTEIVPISAETGENVDDLIQTIERYLPEGEFIYPVHQVTDQMERSIVSEIIREKVLKLTREELPYATAVQIEIFDESRRQEGFVHIAASIVVEKPGQKKIVIGRGGQMVKQIGTLARKDIQNFLGVEKVFLELNVKVIPGWRDREHLLNELGVS